MVRTSRLFPLWVVGISLVLAGCSSTYQSITAYFNTYYNATRVFKDAATEAEKATTAIKDTNYFPSYSCPKTAQDKFDKVIEKCSKLIQFYPNSAYVDDAILMIGKSYVYSGEYESALRKFAELTTNFPNSDLRYEARLWAAKAEYFSRKDDEALNLLRDLEQTAHADGRNAIEQEATLLEAQIAFDRGDYSQASEVFTRAYGLEGDDEMKAFARLQIGNCRQRQHDFAGAAEAYGGVREHTSDFGLEFRSRLLQAKMLIAAGRSESALTSLEDLKQEPLKQDQRGLVELEIANSYAATGDTAKAFKMYDAIDTLYRNTDAAARSYYERALICEERRGDFQSAMQYYDRAAKEFPASDINPVSVKRVQVFTNFFQRFKNFRMFDSLLSVVTDTASADSAGSDSLASTGSDTTFRRGGDSIMVAAVDSSSAHPDTLRRRSPLYRPPEPNTDVPQPLPGGIAADTAHQAAPPPSPGTLLPPPQVEPGNKPVAVLPGPEPAVPDTTAAGEEQPQGAPQERRPAPDNRMPVHEPIRPPGTVPGDGRPIPGDRRERADMADRLNQIPPGGVRDSLGMKPDSLRRMNMPPMGGGPPKLSADTLMQLLAQTELDIAGIYFLDLAMKDSAYSWYDGLTVDFPQSFLVPQAMYAMAEIARSWGDSLLADSLYTDILGRAPKTEYAKKVKLDRGLDTATAEEDSILAMYRSGEKALIDSDAETAIREFKKVLAEKDESPLKPKAMYAIGWAYENILVQNDSAAEWYTRLLGRYPKSPYAEDARPKIAVRNDPKALSQYVKIKEIQPLKREDIAKSKAEKPEATKLKNPGAADEDQQDEEDVQQDQRRGTDDNTDEDTDSDSPDEPDDTTPPN